MYGSPESHEEYARLCREQERQQAEAEADAAIVPDKLVQLSLELVEQVGDPQLGSALTNCRDAGPELSVAELCEAYFLFAQGYYVKNGRSSGQVPHVRRAIRIVNELYGHARAMDFGPRALRTIQARLVKTNAIHGGNKTPIRYSRTTVNLTCEGIRRIFKWAASHQLLPVTIHQALATVPGLKAGRTTAREPEPIRPVAGDVVDATLPHLSPVVADMVRFQRLTGCRPGEVCDVRPIDVDRGGAVWQYRPASHKTEHKGRERIIFVGPKAKAILMPYILRAPSPDAYCFSPAESVAKHVAEMRARRRTRVQPSQQNRRKARPQKAPSTHFCKDAYRRAIVRGVAKANRAAVDQAARGGNRPAPRKNARSGTPTSCGIPRRRRSAGSSAWRPPRRCWATPRPT